MWVILSFMTLICTIHDNLALNPFLSYSLFCDFVSPFYFQGWIHMMDDGSDRGP